MEASSEAFWQRISEEGPTSVADLLSEEQVFALTDAHGAHNYGPLPMHIARGKGARVWDGAGHEYIDCVGAYSAMAHGHLNPKVVRAALAQLEKLTLTSRAVYTSELALFLNGVTLFTGMDACCPMNSGAEAVETCIKIARKWAYTVKGVPADRAEIVVCEGNFHGRTTTIVGFSSQAAYKFGFGPFTPGFVTVPFGDAEALRQAMTPNTAAVLAEPIQAEAGVLVPPEGYLAEIRRVCDAGRALLIWDEVQTGFCRTGAKFAWMHEDAKPNLMAIGKALGGGLLPVSAAMGDAEAMGTLTPGDHGSTFGGNPLACTVALAAMAEMETEGYSTRSALMGSRLMAGLGSLGHDSIAEVRGKGLLVGMEFTPETDAAAMAKAFAENGILTKETHRSTFRFAPPITVDAETVDEIVDRVDRSIRAATS
jgi:ornithine--oxo-acid transaminase